MYIWGDQERVGERDVFVDCFIIGSIFNIKSGLFISWEQLALELICEIGVDYEFCDKSSF